MPITWKSIAAPNLSDNAAAMALAQRSINSGFDAFSNVIKQREAVDEANFLANQEVAKNAYLEQLSGAKTPEELAARQNMLTQMRAALPAQVQAQVRGADETRLATLQRQTLTNNEFNDKATERTQRPIVNDIMTNLYSGTDEGATAASALLAQNPNLMNSPEIQKNITDYKRKLVTQGRDDTRWSWDQEGQQWKMKEQDQKEKLFPLEIDKARASINASNAQVTASNANAAASNEQALVSRANRERIDSEAEKARTVKKLGTALEGNLYKEGVYKDSDITDIAKLMVDNNVGGGKDAKDAGDKRSYIVEKLTNLAKTGIIITQKDENGKDVKVPVPLPLGTVKAAILSSRDKPLSWNKGWADTFEANLRSRIEATYDKKTADGKPMAANRAVDDYQAFIEIMRGTADNAPISIPKGTKR